MSKQDNLQKVCYQLRQEVPDINGVMIANMEGLTIATDFSTEESPRIAAVCAAALGLGSRIVRNARLGEIDEIMVEGRDGKLLIYVAGPTGVLAVRIKGHNLGLVRIEAASAARQVSAILAPSRQLQSA
jgi:predicted regulator of Ras-like GTPase activity (Roadblock/LC7/MglB family)